MRKLIKYFIFLTTIFIFLGFKNEGQSYKIFNKLGVEISYDKLVKEVSKADYFFFGELHNNSTAHYLERELTSSLFKNRKIILGAEMFETHQQIVIDEYLKGLIREKDFRSSLVLWSNYKDYRDLVEFAKKNKLSFIGTNCPRRYAALVARKDFSGLSVLSDKAKSYLAPLPVEFDLNVECYKKMVNIKMMSSKQGIIYFPQAQAIKDATMAYFINKASVKDHLFIHFNGSYHSDNKEGIIWYLKKLKPKAKITNLSVVLQEDINVLEDKNRVADYIVVTSSKRALH